jgi:hypothetical protein
MEVVRSRQLNLQASPPCSLLSLMRFPILTRPKMPQSLDGLPHPAARKGILAQTQSLRPSTLQIWR